MACSETDGSDDGGEELNCVSRRPAIRVSQGVTLNLSLMKKAATPPLTPIDEGRTFRRRIRDCVNVGKVVVLMLDRIRRRRPE